MDEHESAARSARPPTGSRGATAGRGTLWSFRSDRRDANRPRHRRHSLKVLWVVAACAVITGGTGLTAVLARSSGHAGLAGLAASCVAPETEPVSAPADVASDSLDGLGFRLSEPGTFGSVAAGPGSSVYALQACGTEETQLRVLHVDGNDKVVAASEGFDRAALLTSSLVLQGGVLYVGAARLDLSGPAIDAPYDLTLYLLSASNLQVLGSRFLGRGDGLSLSVSDLGRTDAAVLVSTGEKLLALRSGTLSPRTLATFGPSVAQHLSGDPHAPYAAVSVFAPGTPAADAGATVELIDTVTADVVSSARLPDGSQVESLAFGDDRLFVAVGDDASTQVRRFGIPALVSSGSPASERGLPTGLPTTLQTIALDATGTAVWAMGISMMACLDPSTGRVLASAASSSWSASPSAVIAAGPTTYVVTSSGIGQLASPVACGFGGA